MLKGFEGYYKPDFDKLWNEAVFVFDTNVLLDLYRYSPNSRKELLDILKGLVSRIWIPHQFFFEYHERKLTIYDDINTDYETWEKNLKDCRAFAVNRLQNELGNIKNRTGFEIDPRQEQLAAILEDILRDLAESKEQHQSSLNDEPLEEKIAQLFAESYGDPFEDSCLKNVRELAKERLERGIPPGSSKDSEKGESDPDGDLIGWLQTVKFADDEKKPIILVSNDGDWFLKRKGRVIGPYPALLQEMYDKAQQSCYFYKSSQFIKHAKDYLDAQVSDGTIQEAENREKYIAEQETMNALDENKSSGSGRTRAGLLGFGTGGGFLPRTRIFDVLAQPSPEQLRALDALAKPSVDQLRAMDPLAQPSPEQLRALDALAKPSVDQLRAMDPLAQPSPEQLRALDALAKPSVDQLRAMDAMIKPNIEE